MRIAIDKDNNRTYIDATKIGEQYYCPRCHSKVMQKKGQIIAHHFAHFPHTTCNDNYHYEEMSLWHSSWQDQYSLDEQEVIMRKEHITHIADVYIKEHKTVIEFQHSSLAYEEFIDRNEFYTSLSNRLVWVFDMREVYREKRIVNIKNSETKFYYPNPNKVFQNLNIKDNNLHIFFQIEGTDNTENVTLIKLTWISNKGIIYFCGDIYSKEQFDNFILEKYTITINKDSVPYFWIKENCRVMILLNKKDGYKYLFNYSPLKQLEKYKKIYARKENSFNEFKDGNILISDWNSPIWKLVWFKKKEGN